jgi:hypothetical protein
MVSPVEQVTRVSFAQFEREIISERISDKIAAQRQKGLWCGGQQVLGYDVDRSSTSPKLVVNAQEAEMVREIFESYLSLQSLLPVVQKLDQLGWTNKTWLTRKGRYKGRRPFDKCSLHALLTPTNPSSFRVRKERLADWKRSNAHPSLQECESQLPVIRHCGEQGRKSTSQVR